MQTEGTVTTAARRTGRILSPAERRQRNRQEMIEAILAIARDIMRENGIAALSLSELARRLQVTTAALYRYFPSKSGLYDALFRVAMRVFREYITPVWEEHSPGWRQFEAWIEARMRFAQEQPELFSLLFERPVPGFEPSAESMEESREFLAEARRAFSQLIEAGVIHPPGAPERAFDLFIAMTHGLSAQHIANEPHLPIGSGRYGSLIPDALALFYAAWGPSAQPDATPLGAPSSGPGGDP
jgi:AcrR family transcriptional regulator